MASATNLFDEPDFVARYEDWYTGPGRRADRLEKRLLATLLEQFPDAETVLEIGCGTGHFTRWTPISPLRHLGRESQPWCETRFACCVASLLRGDAVTWRRLPPR